MQAIDCYVGLGSNLGDRERSIRDALERLRTTPGVLQVRSSSLYATRPWGFTAQPDFLNAVARVRTHLGPVQLYLALRQIEQTLGRQPRFRWGPREIDLDLLLYGDQRIDRRGLVVPHPSMDQRAFVLTPLRELLPTYRSGDGRSINDLLAALAPEQGVTLVR